jgi:hypothetical protein
MHTAYMRIASQSSIHFTYQFKSAEKEFVCKYTATNFITQLDHISCLTSRSSCRKNSYWRSRGNQLLQYEQVGQLPGVQVWMDRVLWAQELAFCSDT